MIQETRVYGPHDCIEVSHEHLHSLFIEECGTPYGRFLFASQEVLVAYNVFAPMFNCQMLLRVWR